MYKILLLNRVGAEARKFLRQTPGGRGISLDGRYRFYINEPIDDPDFVAVQGKAFKETRHFRIARANTLLLTSEPYSILSYPTGYCRQFGRVLSCQERLAAPNCVHTHAILPWHVGIEYKPGDYRVHLTYDDLIGSAFPRKTKLLSVITSNKAFTRGHQERIDFVRRLKERYGDRIDLFGRGIRGFDDKWDVLAPYKYHIAIENSSSRFYWTEKLSDCFLAGTYPIYYGCTNVADYFPQQSFSTIDIRNFDAAVAVIDRILATDTYEQSLPALEESKQLVLGRYNLFNEIAAACDRLDPEAPREDIELRPANAFFDFHNFYLHTVSNGLFKLRSLFRKKP